VGDPAAGTVLRYSGSPLAYSFSEAHHAKSTVLVELDADRPAATTLIRAPVPRALADVTGTLEDLLGAAGEPYVDHWARVTVTDDVRPTDLYRRVRQRFGHALVVRHRPADPAPRRRAEAVTTARDPLDVAADFVTHVRGSAPDAAEAAVLRRAYEQVVGAERSA
jgi:exonuclease SbcD